MDPWHVAAFGRLFSEDHGQKTVLGMRKSNASLKAGPEVTPKSKAKAKGKAKPKAKAKGKAKAKAKGSGGN